MLFSAFPTAQRSDEHLAAQTYLAVLEPYRLEAVARSVQQFITGKVPNHNRAFAPSAAELAANVAKWDTVLGQIEARKLAPPLASGLISVDFGSGPIDMTKFTLEEQDAILRAGRPPQVTLGPTTMKLQRMSEQKRGFTTGDPVADADAA